MKKIFYLLIGILLLPSIVKADMASPMIVEYDGTVTNPDGIYLYVFKDGQKIKTDKKLEYGEVIPEIFEDGFICSRFGQDDEGNYYCVDPADLTIAKEEYKVTSKELGEKQKALTLVDIDIKKGPAASYKSTGKTIKAGTKITMTQFLVDGSTGPWLYIEYEGVKGFIDSYDGTMVLGDIVETEVITAAKVEIRDINTEKVLKTIEPSTKIKVKIGQLDDWSIDCYVEYDGVKGIVDEYHLVSEYINEEEEYNKYTFEKDMNIYDVAYVKDGVGGGKVIGTLPANTTFTSYYRTDYGYVYYESDNIKGWIDTDEGSQSYEEPKKEEKIEPIKPIKEQIEEQRKQIEENIKKNKAKKDYTLYICIGVGLIASLTSIVIIMLINKKSKNKEL